MFCYLAVHVWCRLISHVNDPTLDDPMPRDYVLYMCPVGLLQQEMLDFWQRSYVAGDWNRAHNYFPHITLCSFFKVRKLESLIRLSYCSVSPISGLTFWVRSGSALQLRQRPRYWPISSSHRRRNVHVITVKVQPWSGRSISVFRSGLASPDI